MSSPDNYEVGYGKPPRETRFAKGRSGNPKGRPKGSQNLATLLTKVGKQRVRVAGSNGTRSITKLEASLIQLSNKAASGDLKAIREFVYLVKACQDAEQTSLVSSLPDEKDRTVMEGILERIRQSEQIASTSEALSGQEADLSDGVGE